MNCSQVLATVRFAISTAPIFRSADTNVLLASACSATVPLGCGTSRNFSQVLATVRFAISLPPVFRSALTNSPLMPARNETVPSLLVMTANCSQVLATAAVAARSSAPALVAVTKLAFADARSVDCADAIAGTATRTAASEILERQLVDMFARLWMESTRRCVASSSSAADERSGRPL